MVNKGKNLFGDDNFEQEASIGESFISPFETVIPLMTPMERTSLSTALLDVYQPQSEQIGGGFAGNIAEMVAGSPNTGDQTVDTAMVATRLLGSMATMDFPMILLELASSFMENMKVQSSANYFNLTNSISGLLSLLDI